MIELIIGGLIAFVLLLCFGVLFTRCGECGKCRGIYTKEELIELFNAIPDSSRIYISIEKGQE